MIKASTAVYAAIAIHNIIDKVDVIPLGWHRNWLD